MNETRVCMIGAGNFATRRLYPYIGAAGGSIAGICTRTRVAAEQNARRFGGEVYDDVETMLDTEKPDCVIAVLGPQIHADMAIRVMELGYPVYIEKPPAMTSTDAIRMAQVSRRTGMLCSTAFKKRYAVVFDRAKQWIEGFPPEQLCSLSIDCASGAFGNETEEKSFLLQAGIHILDLALYLYGDVDQVFCLNRGRNAYAATLRFANGALGSLNLNDAGSFTVPTEEVEIHVHGGNFMRVHNCSEFKIFENNHCTEWREPCTFMSGGDTGADTGLFTEVGDFFAAVKNGHTTRSNIFESVKSMLLYEAILESSRTEMLIKMDYSGIPAA